MDARREGKNTWIYNKGRGKKRQNKNKNEERAMGYEERLKKEKAVYGKDVGKRLRKEAKKINLAET